MTDDEEASFDDSALVLTDQLEDPFATFTEWAGEADTVAYGKF